MGKKKRKMILGKLEKKIMQVLIRERSSGKKAQRLMSTGQIKKELGLSYYPTQTLNTLHRKGMVGQFGDRQWIITRTGYWVLSSTI